MLYLTSIRTRMIKLNFSVWRLFSNSSTLYWYSCYLLMITWLCAILLRVFMYIQWDETSKVFVKTGANYMCVLENFNVPTYIQTLSAAAGSMLKCRTPLLLWKCIGQFGGKSHEIPDLGQIRNISMILLCAGKLRPVNTNSKNHNLFDLSILFVVSRNDCFSTVEYHILYSASI